MKVCGEQSDVEIGFSWITSFFPVTIISLMFHTHICAVWSYQLIVLLNKTLTLILSFFLLLHPFHSVGTYSLGLSSATPFSQHLPRFQGSKTVFWVVCTRPQSLFIVTATWNWNLSVWLVSKPEIMWTHCVKLLFGSKMSGVKGLGSK
jgi:hypothetical protein